MGGVLVTGSGHGIGLATTLRFARAGESVFAGVHHDSPELEAIADRESLPLRVLPLDVTDDESVGGFVATASSEGGPIDVLVNNAGRVLIAPLEDTDDDEAKAIFEINYFGALRMIRAVLPTMRARRCGAIVNVSSVSAMVPVPFYAIYAGSKMALEAAGDALYNELRPFGIRVMSAQVGNVRTSILEHAMLARRFDGQSPYWQLRESSKEFFREAHDKLIGDARPADPSMTADAIYDAVVDSEHRLRVPVGEDAALVAEMRTMLSRQEFSDAFFDQEAQSQPDDGAGTPE